MRVRKRQLQELLCALLATFAVPSSANAQRSLVETVVDDSIAYDAQSPEWTLRAEAVTDFPLSIGARFGAQTPSRFRMSTSLGFIPKPYVQGINAVLLDAGAYPQRVGELIANALDGGVTWRLQAGVAPIEDEGFYIEFGYMLAWASGALPLSSVSSALDVAVPTDLPNAQLGLETLVHSATLELGWEWIVARGLSLRAALGGAFALAARTRFTDDSGLVAQRGGASLSSLGHTIDTAVRSYGLAPIITVAAGYVF